ncbi:MAG: hypothetical protein KDB14_10550 [Planctomycetales bacterium]|nr:hypothetical protein [Planctomycetales bacterium]
MARCDEGYLCAICGAEVEEIVDSDLYLRYVIGMVDAETLHTTPERHLRCNPALAQFIDDERFADVDAGEFAKRDLDPEFVKERQVLVTRGWRRLREIAGAESPLSLLDYPLPEFRHAARRDHAGD